MSDQARIPLMGHNSNYERQTIGVTVARNGYILTTASTPMHTEIYTNFSALVNALAHDLGLLKIGQSLTLEVKP